jgi:hypothetical protein
MKHYLFVMLLIVCGIGIATGEPVEPSLTYQGMLTDPVGTPLDGTYPMIFSLYDEPSGGTPLAINTISGGQKWFVLHKHSIRKSGYYRWTSTVAWDQSGK